MAKWNKSGSGLIGKYALKFETTAIEDFEDKVIDGLTKIIESSPIGVTSSGSPTGVYRNNWQIGRKQSTRVLKSANKGKGRAYVKSKVSGKFKNGGRLSLFNNSPYARVIEFGGYPDPVKKGTYIKGRGYVKRSQGGFSKQAPSGHFRTGVMNLKNKLKTVKGRLK